MKEFWSKRIVDLTPYTPGEQPKDRKFVKLNTNENPYPPAPGALEAIRANTDATLRLYSDPDGSELKKSIAETYGVSVDQVFVGNGSDEVLAFAFQAFFDQGAEIVFPDITYSFYPVYANMFGINYRNVPLNDDFTVPVEALCGNNAGVVIANPNAPTGIELDQSALVQILEGNPDVVVIVDEAYVDFGGTSALPLIEKYPNLLVVQTFSKSRSLAGLRVGFAFGNPNLIQGIRCVKDSINSYTLDRLALAGAAASVADRKYFDECCAKVMATRAWTTERLVEMGFQVYPSKTNFIFISHPVVPAKELFAGLREKGVLVRYFNLPRIDNCLRVSIGTDDEMEVFVQAMGELTKGN